MTTASVRKGKKVKFIIISGPFQFQVKIRWTSSLSFPSPRLHQVRYHIRMLSYSIYLFLFSFLLIFYFSYFQSFLFSIFHYEFDKYHTSDSSVASFELENLETSTSTSTSSESPLPLYWVSVVSLKNIIVVVIEILGIVVIQYVICGILSPRSSRGELTGFVRISSQQR